MKNIAVGYIRVSTAGQAADGVSMDMQIAKIKAYCALEDMELVGIYGDPGISAKSIDKRPGLQAILRMVEKKKIHNVVIYKLDRLARNTVECLEMAEQLDKKGVGLHSITEKLDTKTAVGRFFFTLLASLAEMERRLIGERTKEALGRKKELGERVSRRIPYGYLLRSDGKTLAENPDEMRVVERASALWNDGLSLREVSRILAEEGMMSRTGKEFAPSAISKMVQPYGPQAAALR